MSVIDSTVSDNSASETFTQAGGGIENLGTMSIVGSAIDGNSAVEFKGGGDGGGIGNDGNLAIVNSTISGNNAPGLDSSDNGNAIYNAGPLSFTDTTITNLAEASTNTSPAVYLGLAAVEAVDTIFNGSGGQSVYLYSGASFNSQGHNLFSDAPDFALTSTDLINTDPLLAPLANNGGTTLTQALLPGSPAIAAGVAVSGVTTDQRGIPRPQSSAPDIGAFESRGFTLSIVEGNDQKSPGGSPFPVPLVVDVASPYGEPVAGGQVTFITPSSGPGAVLAGTSTRITLDGQGRASVTASANTIGGTYTVIAQAAGTTSVAFTLTNVVAPTVVHVYRTGVHYQPTALVVTFSEPMNAAEAESLGDYSLVRIGPTHLNGMSSHRAIRIRSARYDPTSESVTLRPIHRLPLRAKFQLTIVGTPPDGLTSATGTFLDGAGTGQPGSDYVVRIDDKFLVPPYQRGKRTSAAVAHGLNNR